MKNKIKININFRWRCSAGDPDSCAAGAGAVFIIYSSFLLFYCGFSIDCVNVYEDTEEHHGVICTRIIIGIDCMAAPEDVSNFSTLGGWVINHLRQRYVAVSPLHGNNIAARGVIQPS